MAAIIKLESMSPKEYAEWRQVHVNTVMRWVRGGRLVFDQPGGVNGRIFIRGQVSIFPMRGDSATGTT